MEFEKLGIGEPVMQAIRELGFDTPTEVQEKTIPLVLKGKNVIVGSATGSGKTLVFGVGIVETCEKGKGLQALVITPTRELCVQVSKELRKFAKFNQLFVAAIYGGLSYGPQFEKLKIADVVVGTPGRLLDHLQQGTIDLSKVKILVLDEADRMLDMGFIDDVERIIGKCKSRKQTMLFSATIDDNAVRLGSKYMSEPHRISAEELVDPSKLTQVYYDILSHLKFSLLTHLLKHEHGGLVMVFCNTRRNVEFVSNNLVCNGIKAEGIHGGLSQQKRESIMNHFHDRSVFVLVCTDVAARGLDIKGVSHIYNYDMPKETNEYIHRIGRTARAGKEGKVINLLSQNDHDNYNRVLKYYRVEIKKEDRPYIENAKLCWQEAPSRGRRFSDDRRERSDRRYSRR
jgi:ATP-dependent RNA helicase DeaD